MATQVSVRPEGVAGSGAETSGTSERSSWRWVIMVLGAVLVLLVGVGAGWLVRGDGGTSSPSFVVRGAVVEGPELTDRQLEMVDVTRQYVAAFIAKDGDAVASFMVPDGELAIPTLGDRLVLASDGSLQEWVEGLGAIPNELTDPIVVYSNTVVLTGSLDPLADWMIMLQFTDSGEVKVVSDTHWGF